ncbi:MAG: hypothetical protein WCP20_23365, partial [Desulfuromonadales bacterium]
LRLWELESGRCLAVMEGHMDQVNGVHLLPAGRALSWSLDYTLRLWELESGLCLAVMEGHSGGICDVLLLPDGRALSWSDDKTLRLWELESGRCLAVMEGHESSVNGVHLLPDGRALSWSEDTLRLWELESGRCLGVYEVNNLFSAPVQVWRAYLDVTTSTAGIYCSINSAIFGYQQEKTTHILYWQSASECNARNLFEDGRAVVTQKNGQFCLLRTYNGDKRVTIGELGG